MIHSVDKQQTSQTFPVVRKEVLAVKYFDCHVSHGIAARCLSACHRQSVGCHPDTDGATAAPFRLLIFSHPV